MSFVNDVMAEEAGRQDLILFEDASIFQGVDLPPIHDSGELKKKYWLNFLLVVTILTIAIGFVDQLPADKFYSVSKESYSEKLDLFVMPSTLAHDVDVIETVIATENNPEEKVSISNVVQKLSTERIPGKIKAPVQQSTQKNNRTTVKSNSEQKKVLDLTTDKVVFNKKILIDQAKIQVDSQLKQAKQLLQQGEMASGIVSLEKVLILDDRHLNARLLLSVKLIEQGRTVEALKVYQEGLSLNPKESRLAIPLAHLLVEEGKVDQSLQVLQKAAPPEKADPDYHSFIAALQQQTGRHGKAITIYQKILRTQPENGKWWLGLGISLMAEARNKEALVAFESSLHDERVSSALKQFASQRINDLKNNQSENRGRS